MSAHYLVYLTIELLSLMAEKTRARVEAFVSCCLDYSNSLLSGVADVQAARSPSVGTERASSSGLWRSLSRPHHAGPRDTSLAASPSASDLQDGGAGVKCLYVLLPSQPVAACVASHALRCLGLSLLVPWTKTSPD